MPLDPCEIEQEVIDLDINHVVSLSGLSGGLGRAGIRDRLLIPIFHQPVSIPALRQRLSWVVGLISPDPDHRPVQGALDSEQKFDTVGMLQLPRKEPIPNLALERPVLFLGNVE